VFGFFVQESPAKLRTLLGVLRLRFAPIKVVCYQVTPCCSDQGVDLGQRVRGLDKYISDLFSWTLLQDASSSSSRLGDYVCTRHLAMSVLLFL
jgi:hypothetical protein